jgi:hypothetical protein
MGRLGGLIKEAVKSFTAEILSVFTNHDFEVLGTAAWAMGEAGFSLAKPFLEKICSRSEPVTIYIRGIFFEKPVGKWAEESLMKLMATG